MWNSGLDEREKDRVRQAVLTGKRLESEHLRNAAQEYCGKLLRDTPLLVLVFSALLAALIAFIVWSQEGRWEDWLAITVVLLPILILWGGLIAGWLVRTRNRNR